MSFNTTIYHSNRLHRHLFTFIVSCYCIQSHLFIINKNEKYKDLIFKENTDSLKEQERNRYIAYKTSKNIITHPYELIYEAIKNDRTNVPITLTFEETETAPPIVEELGTSGLSEIIASQIAQVFLSYWEENKPIFKKINNNPIIDFGKVLRDAFAHQGKIHITNNTEVEHLGLKYDKTNNGRLIIHQDLSVADIINIMLDINSILDSTSHQP